MSHGNLPVPNAGHETPALPIRRVFIDCTSTVGRDWNTGIQRVVRNIVNSAPHIGAELGLECHGVAFNDAAGFKVIDHLPSPSANAPASTPEGLTRGQTLRATLKAGLASLNLLPAMRSIRQALYRAKYLALFPVRRMSPRGIHFGPGDVLLLIDSFWDDDFPWHDVWHARSRGAVVGVLVYDLITIRFPQWSPAIVRLQFKRWWNRVRGVADFLVAISKSVLGDIDAVEGARHPREASPATRLRGAFRLGAELDGTVHGGPVRREMTAVFGNAGRSTTYLMVGMISPRKNHVLAIDAFDRLWAEGAEVKLVLLGQNGWDCDELITRLRGHPQFGNRLFWFQDARDQELDYGYRHAAGLVTTSCAEGFNLPIVEALRQGCPVLASDLPVHREVGGAYAAFFPSGDAQVLADLISRHQSQGALPGVKSSADFHWPDWTESCRELLEVVRELSCAKAFGSGSSRRFERAA